jgi:predicted RNase H-like nuclease (RuvC/YqgF family)
MEQDAAAAPAVPEDPAALPDAPAPAEDLAATPPVDAPAEKIDVATDPDVEKINDKGDSEEKDGTEELDITDLVKSQSNIESKQDDYFENLFGQLSNLESKLSEMDSIMSRLNSIESKIEKYRTKTPQEKLELRSYDSYPFNQKLSDFFEDKEKEMELTGKKEYVLTPDEVTDINASEIKGTFQPSKTDDNQNYSSR